MRNPVGAFLVSGLGELFSHPTGELDVANSGEWGVNCSAGHRFPMNDPSPHNGTYLCCGYRSEYPAILLQDVDIIEEPHRARNRSWWHSSNEPNLLLSGPVHLGSRRAAEDRSARSLDHARANEISVTRYLYEITLNKDARIAPDVMVEVVGSDHSHALHLLTDWDVVRYVNRAEAPGSVSLFVSSDAVRDIRLESIATS